MDPPNLYNSVSNHLRRYDWIPRGGIPTSFTKRLPCHRDRPPPPVPNRSAQPLQAYFLRRFDWRVDELLKDDALLPPLAATKTPGWERTADVDVEVSLTSVAERGWGWNERGWWRMVGCGVWEWEMEQGSREM